MSIIACPECGADVSDSADSCPKCGYGVKKHVTKIRRKESVQRNSPRAVNTLLAVAGVSVIISFIAAIGWQIREDNERNESQRLSLIRENSKFQSSTFGLHKLHAQHIRISFNDDERRTMRGLSAKWEVYWDEHRDWDLYGMEGLEQALSKHKEEHSEWISFYNSVRARNKSISDAEKEAELLQLSKLESLRSSDSFSLQCPDCNARIDAFLPNASKTTWTCIKSGETYKYPDAEHNVRSGNSSRVSPSWAGNLHPLSDSETFESYAGL